MNLLFTAYSIVQSEGGSLPIETLLKKINTSRQFKKLDNSLITISELTELINIYGQNIAIGDDGLVQALPSLEKKLNALFWKIMDLLTTSNVQPEIVGIVCLFYARVSDSSNNYNALRNLPLISINHLNHYNIIKSKFIDELGKLNSHIIFNGKLSSAINLIENVDEFTLLNIIETIEEYDVSVRSISNDEFAIQFQNLFLNIDRFSKSIIYIPEFIRELICKLVISKPLKNIYDPVFGIGEAFTSIKSQVSNSSGIEYFGESTFDIYGFTGTMNLILHQFENFHISTNNPLLNTSIKTRSIECVICQPPFGGQSSTNDWQLQANYLNFGRSNRMEVLFIQLLLDVLNNTGRGFIIMPEGFMISENNTEKSLRCFLLENDYLDSVISLPIGVYENTRIRTNLLFINKNKSLERKGKVLFFDTSPIWAAILDSATISDIAHNTTKLILDGTIQESVSEWVPVDELLNNNFNLQVSHYVNSFSRTIQNLKTHDELIVNLQEIVSDVKFKGHTGDCEYPYIKGGNLSKDPNYPFLKLPDDSNNLTSNVNGKIINLTSVLIAKIGGALNPTIFQFKGTPIAINPNIYALVPIIEKIDVEYFALELNSELVKEQLKTKLVGSAQQYYRLDDLLKIQIRLPKLDEQKRRVSIYREQLVALKRKETEIIATQFSNQKDEITVLSAMKHSFGQKPFKTDLLNLEEYLNRTIQDNKVPNWQDPISVAANARNIREVFERLNYQIDSTNELFRSMENLIKCDLAKIKLEEVKIHDFIKFVVSDIPEINDIDIITNGINIPVMIDKFQFKELVSNFIFNAIKHGFDDSILFKLMVFETNFKEGVWTMKIFNSGNEFPSDFSFDEFITFGKKKEASKGSGIGGYLINKVVKNHNGSLKIVETQGKRFYHLNETAHHSVNNPGSKVFPIEIGAEFIIEFPFNYSENV